MRNLPASTAKRRGRPRLAEPTIVCRLALTLRRGEDDDLIAFFEAIPVRGRPAAVKEALRSGVRGGANAGALAGEERRVEALAAALEQLLA
jgi:hypothetical protein